MLSRDKFDPCLDGGLLPVRLAGRELGLELDFDPGLDPPGVRLDRNDMGLRADLEAVPLSLSERESGVLAVNEVRDVRD